MEHMRRVAYEVVLRACAFGSLAIFCVMIGFSFQPQLAFQTGGTLTMLMTIVLVFKAFEARTKDYRRTEMWLYLPKEFAAARGPGPMGERDGHARHLSYVCEVDVANRDCDVGHGPVLFSGGQIHGIGCEASVPVKGQARPLLRLPMNCRITSRRCARARCSIR